MRWHIITYVIFDFGLKFWFISDRRLTMIRSGQKIILDSSCIRVICTSGFKVKNRINGWLCVMCNGSFKFRNRINFIKIYIIKVRIKRYLWRVKLNYGKSCWTWGEDWASWLWSEDNVLSKGELIFRIDYSLSIEWSLQDNFSTQYKFIY